MLRRGAKLGSPPPPVAPLGVFALDPHGVSRNRFLKYIVYETSKKYYEITTIYECVEILSMLINCNI